MEVNKTVNIIFGKKAEGLISAGAYFRINTVDGYIDACDLCPFFNSTVELQWLENVWDHEN